MMNCPKTVQQLIIYNMLLICLPIIQKDTGLSVDSIFNDLSGALQTARMDA